MASVLVWLPTAAAAQEPDTTRGRAPADTAAAVPTLEKPTAPEDTLRNPGLLKEPAQGFEVVDSIPAGEPSDTTVRTPPQPAERIELPDAAPAGFAEGVWVWDRDALLRSTALSLPGLLEQVPALTRVRSGYFGLPETVAGAAGIGADVEVYLDGYRLDPFDGHTPDLSRIQLNDLQRVRVVRRGGRVRVELTTLAWAGERAYTAFQGATGDLGTNGLGGTFAAPHFLFGPFGIALERLSTDGFLRREPAQVGGGWLRWGIQREAWGADFELSRVSSDRGTGTPLPGKATRQDMIVRTRARPVPWLTGELFAGRSYEDGERADTTHLATDQAGARLGVDFGPLRGQGALRLRSGDEVAPATSLDGDVSLAPLRFVELGGGAGLERWDGGGSFADVEARAVLGPLLGARVFASWSNGSHGVALRDTAGVRVAGLARTLTRAGLDWSLAGFRLGAAALRLKGDAVAPPALPWLEPAQAPGTDTLYGGFDLNGIELSGRIPVVWRPLGLEGDYTRLHEAPGGARSILQPTEQARLGLVYHGNPLGGDQLEIFARIQEQYRGAMLAPAAAGAAPVPVPSLQLLNLDVQVRVLTVRVVVHWGNMLNRQLQRDLPGRYLPGQHSYFGVNWELWN